MKRHWIAIPLGLSVAGGAQGQLENAAPQPLMKKHGCASCHDVDRKVIGPAFRDVAARYKDDKEAATKLANKVKKGGAHVWGEMAMPPNVLISEAEIKDLVNWILVLKKKSRLFRDSRGRRGSPPGNFYLIDLAAEGKIVGSF